MLVVGGENLIDLVQQVQNEGAEPVYNAIPGGSPFNMAIAAGRQQVQTRYLTPISTDIHGDMLFARLQAAHVKAVAARVAAPSSLALVNLSQGVPSYQFYRENTAERQITAEGLAGNFTADDKIFHIGSLALAAISDSKLWVQTVLDCKSKGMLISFDPNVRPGLVEDPIAYREVIYKMFDLSDIIKCSDEDLTFIYQDDNLDVLKKRVLETINSRKIFVITQGEQGAFFLDGEQFYHSKAILAEPFTDTVGAGDTFMSSMIAYLVHGNWVGRMDKLGFDDKRKMVEYAAHAAAINCSRQGCNPPTLDELRTL